MELKSIYGKKEYSFFRVESVLIEKVQKAAEEGKNRMNY